MIIYFQSMFSKESIEIENLLQYPKIEVRIQTVSSLENKPKICR